jgi:hypothetical protein
MRIGIELLPLVGRCAEDEDGPEATHASEPSISHQLIMQKTSDPKLVEQVCGIFCAMDLLSARALAERVPRELVWREFEGESAFVGNAREDDAHDVGDSESQRLEDGCCLFFDLRPDSGSDDCIFGHAGIVAHMGYRHAPPGLRADCPHLTFNPKYGGCTDGRNPAEDEGNQTGFDD